MILDLDKLDEASAGQLHCDVCVVGGGAVGLALATTVAAQGARVLLLEGGGTRLESDSQALQSAESVGRPFTYMDSRYRVLGGTTLYWGGQVYPFDEFVTGARPWLGHEAWLVTAEEMRRWFESAYRLLGLGDAIADDGAVLPAAGVKHPDLGPDLELVSTRWVKTRNFARLFAGELRRSAGLTALTHANVTALRLDPGRHRVQSAVVRSLRGRQVEVTAGRFVLANGTLEIARLLLHPLADGTQAPWAGLRWLGAPLIDHLDGIAADVHVLDYERFHEIFDTIFVNGIRYFPKLRLARAAQRREGLVDIAAQFHYRTRFTEDMEYFKGFLRSIREGSSHVKLAELPQHLGAIAATAWPLASRYLRNRRSFKPREAKVSLGLYSEQLPTAASRLSLGDQRDAIGMQRLRVHWAVDGREIESMRRFTQIIGEELQARGLARLEMDPALAAGDPAFLNGIHDAVHHMGVARMGTDRDQGVVDSDLKVFDVENLYVAGAAVFASTGFANPTFTAIALALRLAHHLAGRSAA